MKKLAIAWVLAVTAVVAACGSSDGGGSSSGTSGTPGPSADSGAADGSTPDGGAADTSTPAGPTTVTVAVTSNVFTPAEVTIKVGDTVKWVWGGGIHNVVSGLSCAPNGTFTSGAPTGDTSTVFSRTFDTAGTFDYYCEVHCTVGMTGRVIVQ